MTTANHYPMPFTRVELAILSLVNDELCVLLIKRASEPFAGQWALPGGVVRIDLDSDLDATVQRIAMERIGQFLPFHRQLTTIGTRDRDPRAPWSVSVIYRALVPKAQLSPQAGKRVEEWVWQPVKRLRSCAPFAFEHQDLISKATDITRQEVERLDLPIGFVPESFTLGELQHLCESLLGRSLDKSSFRRKLADRDLVEPIEGEMKTGTFRPAQLYRVKPATS